MDLKKILALTAILLCGGLAAWAQEAPTSFALEFTRINRNPRTSALAGAGSASLGYGAFGAFNGAAALPFLSGTMDAGLGVQLWTPGAEDNKTTNINLGTGFCIGNFGFGLGSCLQVGVPIDNFRPTDFLVSGGFAGRIGRYVSLGANFRFASSTIADGYKVNGFSADLQALVRISNSFSVTLGVANLGPNVKTSSEFPQPAYSFAGLAWRNDFEEHSLEAMLDGEVQFAGGFAGMLGLEYGFRDLFFARAGYRLANEKSVIPSHLALGLGVQFSSFRLEASWITASAYLANTLNFGLGYRF